MRLSQTAQECSPLLTYLSDNFYLTRDAERANHVLWRDFNGILGPNVTFEAAQHSRAWEFVRQAAEAPISI